MIYIKKQYRYFVGLQVNNMKIIELPKRTVKERKKIRHKNIEKNKHAYAQLKNQLVPKEMKLYQFRRWYHPTLSTKEKDALLELGIDPWSIEGIKYVGDCRRYNLQLGERIPFDEEDEDNQLIKRNVVKHEKVVFSDIFAFKTATPQDRNVAK